MARRRIPWWWLIPALVIAVAAVPNAVLIILARRIAPAPVEDRPYLASETLDRIHAGRAAFTDAGLRFAVEAVPGGLLCRLEGPVPATAARVQLARSDGGGEDRSLPWGDPRAPLAVPGLRPGHWTASLDLGSWQDVASGSAVVGPR